MKKLFVLANLSFLLTVCGCGESKEDKAVREFKEAATKNNEKITIINFLKKQK